MKPEATIPRATCRLQFHRGFTLRDARNLVPYLDALGVSHLYASPLLRAAPGSTHGYDVCDPTRLNPDLGTEADLEALAGALRERGMGLVLDIVPNHMAAAAENPWWWDVLRHGRASRFAGYFDIDWDSAAPGLRGKVLLAVLGDDAARVLARGELRVAWEHGEVTVRYAGHRFPASPESIPAPHPSPEEAVAALNADPRALERFLDRQHYRLACWRLGDARLNYRRFFTVSHLAGVRVEVPRVFAATHQHILRWHRRGLLDGLRVDHPDGLRDPQAYLERLRRTAPGAWIVVEKILEPGEDLPADWPVAGTTGYDFLNLAGGLLIDPAGEKPLTRFYADFTGEPTEYPALVRRKKLEMLGHGLAAEVDRLTRLLQRLAPGDERAARFGFDSLQQALTALVACFPVYRTYVRADPSPGPGAAPAPAPASPSGAGETDARVIATAVAAARGERPDLAALLDYIGDLLRLRVGGEGAAEFVMRFQQLTGPAMAKGVEDTAFYGFNRFVALNEVGGDPAHFGVSVEEFHRACAHTRRHWPHTMLATSTHDTKRGEDARARLALLSEIPERWSGAVRRWSAMNEHARSNGWPDRNAEYLFYQTLVGAWPLEPERALAYMTKAAREARQHTRWTDPNTAYEAALARFVAATLNDREFMADVERFVTPLLDAGWVNALAQTLLKLTAPGVPDLYQGTELGDFALVDPDNRRPVDFARCQAALAGLTAAPVGANGAGHEASPDPIHHLLQHPADGRLKLGVVCRTLQWRRQHAPLFRDGDYLPLLARGARAEHVCGFARAQGGAAVLAVVPRLVLGLAAGREGMPLGEAAWGETRLILPRTQTGGVFRNVFTGERLCAGGDGANVSLRLGEVLGRFPIALLERLERPAQPTTNSMDAS
ncbi:MAG: malto-oligosyltrehalose synthase [Verrucomicrobia bacterium]|nr:malto-oligosyltrehalose synthase [Verrucomicrobiota bacterium]